MTRERPDDLLDRLLEMIDHENPEVQCAAALVVGTLGIDTPVVRRALTGAMKSKNDVLRRYALEGLKRLGAAGDQVEKVVPLLAGSADLQRRASQTLRETGAAAVPTLVETIRAKPLLRAASIDTLAGMEPEEAWAALYDLAADGDPAIARPAIEGLQRKVAGLPNREPHAPRAVRILKQANPKKNPEVAVAAVRLVAAVGGPEAVAALLPLTAKGALDSVRHAALKALSEMPIPEEAQDAAFERLVVVLHEPNFEWVVRPALDVIGRIEVARKHFNTVRNLLKSEHRSVRSMAVRLIGKIGGPAASRMLFDALQDPERKVQETAAAALAGNPKYVSTLIGAFQRAKTPQEAWRMGALLTRQKDALDKKTLQTFCSRALECLRKKEGHFQAYFEIVRAASAEMLRDQFLKAGADEIQRRRFEDAVRILRHLDREDLATSDTDVAFGAAAASLAPRDSGRPSGDPLRALLAIARAVRREDRNVVDELAKYRRSVAPEAYLFVGFHLAEKPGLEREFAGELLEFVARTFKGTEAARTAERKLHSEIRRR